MFGKKKKKNAVPYLFIFFNTVVLKVYVQLKPDASSEDIQ